MVKTKRITLKDISRAVNLAVPTVSKILNGKETFCSEAKVREVQETALHLGYCRNMGYNIMTGGETNIVAIIFSQKYITHNHHINLLYMHLCSKLKERNFASYCSVLDINMSEAEQLEQLRELDDLGCRYYIFIGYPTAYPKLQELVQARSRHFICMNNEYSPRRVETDITGAYINYMIDFINRGITNFRIFNNRYFFERQFLPEVPEQYRELIAGTLAELPRYKALSENPDQEFFQQGYEVMAKEISRNPGLQGGIFFTDYHAFGAAKLLQERNISGVELCGMNCSIAAAYAFTPVTTTKFDMNKCAELLLDNMCGTDAVNISLPGQIVTYGE